MAGLVRLRFPQTGAVITVAAEDAEAMQGAGFKLIEAQKPAPKKPVRKSSK